MKLFRFYFFLLLVTALFTRSAYAIAPSVYSIRPTSGPTSGGAVVTIGGGYFTGATGTFGGVAAINVVLVNGGASSSATITATTPAHAAGYVNVVVTTPGGSANRIDTTGFVWSSRQKASRFVVISR